MTQFSAKDSVEWFRSATPYIRMHKGKTFVFVFDTSLSLSPNFKGFIHDLNLLLSIGIKVVLIYGFDEELKDKFSQPESKEIYDENRLVISKGLLSTIQERSGKFRIDLEARLSTNLPNSPMEGSNIRASSGNFIFARPLGIINGVDTLFAGEVEKIDVAGINDRLNTDEIVILSPLGFSPTGEIFLLRKEQVGELTAINLKADKLIFINDTSQFRDNINKDLREIHTDQLVSAIDNGTMPKQTQSTLEASLSACQRGVRRVHLVDQCDEYALITELFTHRGMGILITKSTVESMRDAKLGDADGILELIKPLQEVQILIPRTKEAVEEIIKDFTVLEHDGTLVGCVALHGYNDEKIGELACLVVHPSYQKARAGINLLARIESKCRARGIQKIFVLTTRSSQWFVRRGFAIGNIKNLPIEKQAVYNSERNAKVLVKNL